MKGYWHDPEATAAAFTGDWLHTGDLGYFDEDGFLFIVSRQKELIIRGGYNVYPSEIENVLHAHPAIAEAAVVGVPDERLGEEVMAVVILRPGMVPAEHELVSYCRQRLAAYKCPRVFQFRAQLPKNTLGKVLKDELVRAERHHPHDGPDEHARRRVLLRRARPHAHAYRLGRGVRRPGSPPGVLRLFEAKLPRVPRYRQVVRTTPLQLLRPGGPTISTSPSGTTSATPPSRRLAAPSSSAPPRPALRPAAGPEPAAVGGMAAGGAGGRPLGHLVQDPSLHGGRDRRQRPDDAGLR